MILQNDINFHVNDIKVATIVRHNIARHDHTDRLYILHCRNMSRQLNSRITLPYCQAQFHATMPLCRAVLSFLI